MQIFIREVGKFYIPPRISEYKNINIINYFVGICGCENI